MLMTMPMPTSPSHSERPKALRVLALADHMGHRGGKVHGGTTYFVSVYPALVRAGVDLTVAFLSPPHPSGDKLREQGIEPVFFSRHKWDPRAMRDVRELVYGHNFDVLHLASFRSHFAGRRYAHRRGLPCLVHLHDTVPLSPGMKFLQRRVYSPMDLAVGVSGPVGELGVTDYGIARERVRVLHNAIDVEFYARPRPEARCRLCAEWGIDPAGRLIGAVGRLAEMKGHRYLIDAMPSVLESCPDARLIIVGQGELNDQLRAQAARHQLSDKVRFVGQRGDIPEVLAALDVLAMPSVSGEGLPFVAIEAIASGLPIVAYPTAGIPEVVLHERCGLLVEHGRVAPLAEALAKVLNDDALRATLSRGGREHAQHFTMQRHIAQLIAIYQELAKP